MVRMYSQRVGDMSTEDVSGAMERRCGAAAMRTPAWPANGVGKKMAAGNGVGHAGERPPETLIPGTRPDGQPIRRPPAQRGLGCAWR